MLAKKETQQTDYCDNQHAKRCGQLLSGVLYHGNEGYSIVASTGFTSEHIPHPFDRQIYKAFEYLISADRQIELSSVFVELRSNEWQDEGIIEYLSSLVDKFNAVIPSRESLKKYAQDAKKIFETLELQNHVTSSEFLKMSASSPEIQKQIFDLQEKMESFRSQALNDEKDISAKSILCDLTNSIDSEVDAAPCISTGLQSLDELFDNEGMEPGTLNLIGGRPHMGKTVLSLNIVEHNIRAGKRVLYFSLDTTSLNLMRNLLAIMCQMERRVLSKKGFINMSDRHRSAMNMNIPILHESKLCIDDSQHSNVSSMSLVTDQYVRDHGGVDLIVVDFIQQVKDSGSKKMLHEIISDNAQALKHLARKHSAVMLALAQLNRQTESRPDKTPTMSDLKGCGGLEEQAEFIVMPYRDEYYHEDSRDKGFCDLHVLKNKHGATGKVAVRYDDRIGRFQDLAQGY